MPVNPNVIRTRYKVNLNRSDFQPKILPSGALLMPTGHYNLRCQSGLHTWTTKMVMGIPYMTCIKCGYHMPKPVLEKTSTKREMLDIIHKNMEKERSKLLPRKGDTRESLEKRRGEAIVEMFERKQRTTKKTKTGKTKYIGERR